MREGQTSGLEIDKIRISVIIPLRNEEGSVTVLLDNLLSQTRLPDEIVITDGGSTDRTREIIEDYIERGAPIRLVSEGPALPGRGRNLAAARASREWLAFIDGGIRPEKNWLAALAARAEREAGVDVVYGGWEPVTDSLFKECAAIAYVPPPVRQGSAFLRPEFIASSLMRQSVWRGVGGFPEHLRSAEDLLFMEKIREAGFNVVHEPRAVVHWNIQPNLRRTFKRFITYSRNNLLAGLGSRWQAAIFKRYGLLLLLALPLLLLLGIRGLALTALLWLLMLWARAAVAIVRNRRAYPASLFRNILRLLVMLPILAVLDAAAIIGSLSWLLNDKLHLTGGAVGVSNGA